MSQNIESKTITVETKVWEGDWRIILETDRLKKMFERNCFTFTKRVLFINNVNDPAPVKERCQQLIAEGVIDRYIVVADYAEAALTFLG